MSALCFRLVRRPEPPGNMCCLASPGMSIYEAIGGPDAVHATVEDFYPRLLDDPQLSPFFGGIDLGRLKSHQRAFIAAALDGPDIHAGRDMVAAHAGLTDSAERSNRFGTLCSEAEHRFPKSVGMPRELDRSGPGGAEHSPDAA